MNETNEDYWKEKRGTIGVVVTIITFSIGMALTFVLSNHTYKPYLKATIILSGLLVLLYITYLIFDVVKYKLAINKKILDSVKEERKIIEELDNEELNKKIKEVREERDSYKNKLKKYKKEENPHRHKRFENLIKKELRYIALDYKPFFWLGDDKKESPKGIGFESMRKIFEPFETKLINITPPNGYSWKTIFEDFSEKRDKIDFIMTPMYETRSRLYEYDVIYSMPLFYSDIGVYVKNTEDTKDLKLSFDGIKDFLKGKRATDNWELEYLDGEISEIVGKKVLYEDLEADHPLKTTSEDDTRRYGYKDFSTKLNNVASEDKTQGDVIFMERFKAESIIKDDKLGLTNILKDNQLVYPVCFVLHKEETVLRNFINLRIAELRFNGELSKIIKSNAFQVDITDEKVLDKVFIQHYNFSLIDGNYVKKVSRFSDNMKSELDLLDKVYKNYKSFQLNISETLQNFRKPEGLNILEIGFGSGIILDARKSYHDNFIAVDDDDLMKYQIEQNRNVNPKKVQFQIFDALKFLEKYKGEPFDIIVSGYTIHNFSKEYRHKLYNAMFSKMSSNSIFINADKISSDDDIKRIEGLKFRINKYIEYLKLNPNKFPLIEEWVTHYINDQSEEIVMKETETRGILSQIGFEDIEVNVPKDIDEKEMMAILTARRLD